MRKPDARLNELQLKIEYLPTSSLIPDPKNARNHTKRQTVQLAASMREFGFINPCLIDEKGRIIAGHARLEAGKEAGLATLPCIRIAGLSEASKMALAIADNRLGDLSTFDPERLKSQLKELTEIDFPTEVTGFITAEIDILIETPRPSVVNPGDWFENADRTKPSVSKEGDLWQLDKHRLVCGDALKAETYRHVLNGQLAGLVFADPPYNVPIQRHVSGLGKAQHPEFIMASGEMSAEAFKTFLSTFMAHLVSFTTDGSIHYLCIDWRGLQPMLEASGEHYSEQKALCVWNKTNGGMGSLYRSKHELVLVYKNGTAPHVNNVELGRHGRYRTNVWDYAGANAFRVGRDKDLADHPTVKPVALVADAIRDCSKRGSLVLDPFAGSGTILLAAERTGRRAAAIELDGHYVDVAVRRWQQATGRPATLAGDGRSFDEITASLLEREAAGE